MEDVLAVYTRPRDGDRPLVCLDETSKQLTAETRVPIPMRAGRPARVDYEYERNGTANLFMMFAPLEGWRHVKVTDRHTAVDYAHVLKELVDIHFANAKTIVFRGARKCARSATRRSTLRSRDRPCRRRGQGRSGASSAARHTGLKRTGAISPVFKFLTATRCWGFCS